MCTKRGDFNTISQKIYPKREVYLRTIVVLEEIKDLFDAIYCGK